MNKIITLVQFTFLFTLILSIKTTIAQNCTSINFNDFTILSSNGNQDNGVFQIQNNGATLYIANNAWKAIEVNYPVLSNTILEFEFKSTVKGEIHGIGLNNLLTSIIPSNVLNIYGTQNISTDNIASDDYNLNGNWQSFRVDLGTYVSGTFNYLVFIADDDANANGNSFFRNVKIYEPTTYAQVNSNLVINEIQASNNNTILDNFLEYDDWIEIYNTSNNPIDLAGYYLSDDVFQLNKFQIPNSDALLTTIPANGHLLFWADNDVAQGINHSNFKLSSSGERVFLVAQDGTTIIDSIMYTPLKSGQTYKRIPDGTVNLAKSAMASPANTNDDDFGFLEPPVFSLSSGTYNGNQTISLFNAGGATIYYTTDGSAPNTNSPIYNTPITITQNTSIRAIAAKCGFENSDIITQAYIIGVNHDLPILTLNINDEYLYSDTQGMLVVGTNGIEGCGGVANYHQEWEYPGNVTLLNTAGNEAFNVEGGLSVFGNCSRRYAQKSLALKTKDIYQSKNIPYKVFPTQTQDEFRRLRFRNGGNHWKNSMIADLIFHQLIEKTTNADVQSTTPVVSYINGDYNGIFNIRHAYSKHYFRYNHKKYENSDFDILRMAKSYKEYSVVDGDSTDFKNLFESFENTNLFTPQKIDLIYNTIDIDNFIDYYSSMMWVWTLDWPATYSPSNQIFWKPKEQNTKWRIAVLDVDGGFSNVSHNTYSYMNIPDSLGRNTEEATRLFRRLNQDIPKFNEEFVQRAFTYCNIIFNKDSVAKKINNYKSLIENEMHQHINKWGNQGGVPSYNVWLDEVEILKTYANGRSDTLKNHIANYHNKSIINLAFNFNQNTNGYVALNSNFFKVPENYVGEYLEDIPMWLHAIPNPGYRFVEWQGMDNTAYKYQQSVYRAFNTNKNITPIFEPALDVVINEIHYNPLGTSEAEEFIELYNPDNKAKPLFGYQFNNGVEFSFPENVVINPNEYIIIANDASIYENNGYQVFQWTCGNLNNDGEMIQFSNAANVVIDSVRYNDNIDWNQDADGLGYSLALIDHSDDNAQPAAWTSQAIEKITPGAKNQFCIPISINTFSADVSCYQANDGFIATQISGGTSPYNYSWSNGDTGNTISNLSVGQYTLTVTDFFNCAHAETYNINQPTPLQAITNSSNQTYYNTNNGTASVNVIGGIAPYSYNWSNGANTASITGLAPLSYTVNITDANNCSITETIHVQAIDCSTLTASITKTDQTYYQTNNGSATANVVGGFAPYSYNWSNGASVPSINNLPAGSYNINVVDAIGCIAQDSVIVNGITCNTLQVDVSVSHESCFGEEDGLLQINNIQNGMTPYSVLWSTAVEDTVINNLTAGDYQLNITDNLGCPFEDSYTINAATEISVNTIVTDASSNSVQDGSIELIVNGGMPPYTFNWLTLASSQNIGNLLPGNYSVSISDANNCQVQINNIVVGNNCLSSIVQQNYPPITTAVFQVADFIQSNGIVLNNEQVSFKAGSYIELTDSFEVKQDAAFEAKIDGCD